MNELLGGGLSRWTSGWLRATLLTPRVSVSEKREVDGG